MTHKILFIGNSHTYFHDMPNILCQISEKNGIDTEAVMLAHGGMGFGYHVEQPEVRYNILYGGYEYIVLQHKAHPFDTKEEMFTAGMKLSSIISQTHSKPVLYMTWSEKNRPEAQAEMSKAYWDLGKQIDAFVAPVGEYWQTFLRKHPEAELYFEDGLHASVLGSKLAAYTLFSTIYQVKPQPLTESDQIITALFQ